MHCFDYMSSLQRVVLHTKQETCLTAFYERTVRCYQFSQFIRYSDSISLLPLGVVSQV